MKDINNNELSLMTLLRVWGLQAHDEEIVAEGLLQKEEQ